MAKPKVTLETLNAALFLRFPVLKTPEYARLVGSRSDGPYVIFGIIFNRYIENMAYAGHRQDWTSIGTFIEDLSRADDDNIQELLQLEVLPTLLKSQRIVDTYWEHLGAKTQQKLNWLAPKLTPQIQLPSL